VVISLLVFFLVTYKSFLSSAAQPQRGLPRTRQER
jgi:hypothetical protein